MAIKFAIFLLTTKLVNDIINSMKIANRYKNINLNNGAVLRYSKNKLNKITSIEILFNCGAYKDTIPGLAHFVEHMFFTGTRTMSKQEVSKKYFDYIGSNAHTTSKNISFTGKIFTKELQSYLSTVATLITESTFTQDAVEKEKKVVCQEIARNEDRFGVKAGYFNDYNLTGLDCHKNTILGSEESVNSIKSKDVKQFVKDYFVTENLEVYITSPKSLRKVKKMVEKELVSKLPSNSQFVKMPLFLPTKKYEFFYKVETKDIDKCYIFINFKSNLTYFDIEKRQKLNLMLDMVNETSEGVMKELRLEKSLIYGGGFYVTYNDNRSILGFETECNKKNINEVITTVQEYISKILKNGFDEELYNKVKRYSDYSEDSAEPKVGNKMNRLTQFKYFGKILEPKQLKKIRQETTLEECNNLFKEIFQKPELSVSIYGDITKKELLTEKELKKVYGIK